MPARSSHYVDIWKHSEIAQTRTCLAQILSFSGIHIQLMKQTTNVPSIFFLWINFINAHTSQTEFQLQTLETLQPLMKQDETPFKHYSANAHMYIYICVCIDIYIYIYAQKTSAIHNQPENFDLMGCTLTYKHLHGASHNHSKLVTTAIRHTVPRTQQCSLRSL